MAALFPIPVENLRGSKDVKIGRSTRTHLLPLEKDVKADKFIALHELDTKYKQIQRQLLKRLGSI